MMRLKRAGSVRRRRRHWLIAASAVLLLLRAEVLSFAPPPLTSSRAHSSSLRIHYLKSRLVDTDTDVTSSATSKLHISGGKPKHAHPTLSDMNIDERTWSSSKPHIYRDKVLSRAQTVFVSIVLAFLLTVGGPPDANAGFGPSGGATTSPPPNLNAPNVDITSGKKLKQLIGSTLDEKRLAQFSIQLDEVAETLNNLLSDYSDSDTSATNPLTTAEKEAKLEKARVLQKQVLDRERILAKLEKQPYWFNYCAAFIGSVASTLVMHPLDTIKTRLQVKGSSDGSDDDGERIGSVLGLYEGLTGNLLKEGPPSALYLGVYESVKYSLLPQYGPQSVLLVYLASGAAGEMVGSIVRAPAEAIKSTVQSGISGSALEAAMQVFGTPESRTNVFRAWSSSVWRDVPFGAIQLAVFELTKTFILNSPDIDFDSGTLLSEALIGAFAGGCGAFVTNPFDVITTRIITQDVEGDSKPLGVVEMAKKLYDEGGPATFLVGWRARVLYWAPAISIFLTVYCSVRQAGVMHGWFGD